MSNMCYVDVFSFKESVDVLIDFPYSTNVLPAYEKWHIKEKELKTLNNK